MSKIKADSVDLKKLKDTFTDMNNEKGILGLALLNEINFQQKTLTKMRKDIEESSLVAEYSNYKRSNPIIAGYNAMIKNYSQLIRQCVDMLPTENQIDVCVDDLINGNY